MGTRLFASKLSYILEESESYTALLTTSLSSLLESAEHALENLPPNAAVMSTLASLQSTYGDLLRLKQMWQKKNRSIAELKDKATNQQVDSMFPFATHYVDSVDQVARPVASEWASSEWQEWRQLLSEFQIQIPPPDSRFTDEALGHGEGRNSADGAADTETHGGNPDGDDELVVTKEKTSFVCPITQQHYVTPMMNPACKHSYSHAAILQLCARGRGSVPCPVAGCERRVDSRALMPNHSLERAMKRDQKRRAHQASE